MRHFFLLFFLLCAHLYSIGCDLPVQKVDTSKMNCTYNSLKYKYKHGDNEFFLLNSIDAKGKDTLCIRLNDTKFFTDKKFVVKRQNFTKFFNDNYSIEIDGKENVPPFATVKNSMCHINYCYSSKDVFEVDSPCYISDSSLTISKFRVGQTKEEFWKILNRNDIPNKESYDIVYLINNTGRDSYLINDVDLYIEFVDSKISCIIIL